MSDAAAQRRARQTVINLALSLLATLGLVLAIVLMVPRDDTSKIQHVDYVAIARDAAKSSNFKIIAPDLPRGWWSNSASWAAKPADTVPAFTAGFVGPKNEYIGIIQGFGGNPTWLALKLQGDELTGAIPAKDSGHWDVYTSIEKHDPVKDWDYVRVLTIKPNEYVILFGNASTKDFDLLASSIESKEAQIVN